MTLACQNFGRKPDCFDEIASYFGERRQKEIAKAMAAKFTVAAKAMTKETRNQSRIFRERDHAVAYVARWQHLQLFAQTS